MIALITQYSYWLMRMLNVCDAHNYALLSHTTPPACTGRLHCSLIVAVWVPIRHINNIGVFSLVWFSCSFCHNLNVFMVKGNWDYLDWDWCILTTTSGPFQGRQRGILGNQRILSTEERSLNWKATYASVSLFFVFYQEILSVNPSVGPLTHPCHKRVRME